MIEENKIVDLNIDNILPNRFQPRINFDEDDLTALANSIREHGVLQPITVRPLGNKYEIIMGERRFKASKLAGLKTIPSIIKQMNDNDSAEVALIENIQRQDLTSIEEAICYKRILDAGYLTQESLAIKLGKTQSTIANKLRLLSLDEDVQRTILDKEITERHARSLLKLVDKNQQRQMLKRIIGERLTVRKTDEEIEKMNNDSNIDISNKPIEIEDIEIIDFDDKTQDLDTFTNEPVEETKLSSLNIPTSPIIDEEENVPNRQPSFLNNQSQFDNVNIPSFMNVDNIMEKAQDINVDPPLNNIDSMLLPPKNKTTEDTEEFGTQDYLKPVNFINILNNEVTEEKNQPLVPEENFDFNSYFAPVFADENQTTAEVVQETDDFSKASEALINNKNNDLIEADPSTETLIPEVTINENEPIDEIDIYKGPTEEQLNVVSEPINNAVVANKDMRFVINTIRECANRLETAGYIIDLEEIDFEDSYQAIFKINKN